MPMHDTGKTQQYLMNDLNALPDFTFFYAKERISNMPRSDLWPSMSGSASGKSQLALRLTAP
jgi:hypothetical protein